MFARGCRAAKRMWSRKWTQDAVRSASTTLPLTWRRVAQSRDERVELAAAVRGVAPASARGIVRQPRAVAPGVLRTDRPELEAAAAVRADVVEHVFDARGTEGAFVRADAGVVCVRREVLVAELAVGSQLEHRRHATESRVRRSLRTFDGGVAYYPPWHNSSRTAPLGITVPGAPCGTAGFLRTGGGVGRAVEKGGLR